MTDRFAEVLAANAEAVEATLDRLLPPVFGPQARLFEAMRYATLGGGKRLRPFLVTASASLFGVPMERALRVAAAVELVHCYSLVHDDLPAMDDDDLRRGRPTLHVAFDEATAILAGDALLTQAFAVLADPQIHDTPAVALELIRGLAAAAGGDGMVGGQILDLDAEQRALDIGEITRLQRLKTGALIGFSCTAGAVLGGAGEAARHALSAYAHDLGLAFQIADDLLDEEGDAAVVGKAVRKDAEAGKATFVAILGVERARDQARVLAEQAGGHLEMFGDRGDVLRQVARFVIERRA